MSAIRFISNARRLVTSVALVAVLLALGALASVPHAQAAQMLPAEKLLNAENLLHLSMGWSAPVTDSANPARASYACSLSEDFESATTPALPAGWATVPVYFPSGTEPNWKTATGTVHPSGGGAHSPTKVVYFNSWSTADPKSARLYYTSALDFSAAGAYSLSFWMYHDTGYMGDHDTLQVQVSTNAGVSWVNAGTAVIRDDGTTGWRQETVDLAAYAGQSSVSISFLGISSFGNDVHLDDITLTCGGAKLATTTTITSSPNPCATGQCVTFTATVQQKTTAPVKVIPSPQIGPAPLVDPGKTITSTAPVQQSIPAPAKASAPKQTGTVTFFDDGKQIGQCTLVNGSCSIQVCNLSAGAHSITAQYGGDTDYGASASVLLAQTMNQQPSEVPEADTLLLMGGGLGGTRHVGTLAVEQTACAVGAFD